MNTNGLVLNDKFVPREVLVSILDLLAPEDLLVSRIVCQEWNDIFEGELFKKKFGKCSKLKGFDNLSLAQQRKLNLPWYCYYKIFAQNVFQTNLVKNGCGHDGLMFWHVEGPFSTKSQPATPFPKTEEFKATKSCFLVERPQMPHRMSQIIRFPESGIYRLMMDNLKPTITASFWCALQTEGVGEYLASATLCLNSMNYETENKNIKVTNQWQKVELKFQFYGYKAQHIELRLPVKSRVDGDHSLYITNVEVQLALPTYSNFDWSKLKSMNYWQYESTPLCFHLLKDAISETSSCHWFQTERILNRNTLMNFILIESQNFVDLQEYGAYDFIVDKLQPQIGVFVYYLPSLCSSFSSLCSTKSGPKFSVRVSLLDKMKKVLLTEIRPIEIKAEDLVGNRMPKFEFDLKNYGLGVRYVQLDYWKPTWIDVNGQSHEVQVSTSIVVLYKHCDPGARVPYYDGF